MVAYLLTLHYYEENFREVTQMAEGDQHPFGELAEVIEGVENIKSLTPGARERIMGKIAALADYIKSLPEPPEKQTGLPDNSWELLKEIAEKNGLPSDSTYITAAQSILLSSVGGDEKAAEMLREYSGWTKKFTKQALQLATALRGSLTAAPGEPELSEGVEEPASPDPDAEADEAASDSGAENEKPEANAMLNEQQSEEAVIFETPHATEGETGEPAPSPEFAETEYGTDDPDSPEQPTAGPDDIEPITEEVTVTPPPEIPADVLWKTPERKVDEQLPHEWLAEEWSECLGLDSGLKAALREMLDPKNPSSKVSPNKQEVADLFWTLLVDEDGDLKLFDIEQKKLAQVRRLFGIGFRLDNTTGAKRAVRVQTGPDMLGRWCAGMNSASKREEMIENTYAGMWELLEAYRGVEEVDEPEKAAGSRFVVRIPENGNPELVRV